MADISADIPSSIINAIPSGSVSLTPKSPISTPLDVGYNVSVAGIVTVTGGTTSDSAAFNTGLN